MSNTSVKHMLEEQGVKLMSPIMYSNIRDGDGQLTDFKSGDRFVYVSPLSTPLPRQHQVGSIQCLLFHHGQDITCSACGEKGHRVGNSECKAKPKENITAFRSYEHTLSNHYPCQIKIWDTEFKSLEHAYFWRMSTEFGNQQLATKIQKSKHAGEAKRLSKDIADDEKRRQWEKDNIEIMKELLSAKAKQCQEFLSCLM